LTGEPDDGHEEPVEAESSASTLIVCVAPCAPADVLGLATGFTTYWPFTTPGVPTARTVLPDVDVPLTALCDVRTEPVPPEAVWALTEDIAELEAKLTL
jgi:hypothetical protein